MGCLAKQGLRATLMTVRRHRQERGVITRVMIIIPLFDRLAESEFGVEPPYNFETHRNVVHGDKTFTQGSMNSLTLKCETKYSIFLHCGSCSSTASWFKTMAEVLSDI